MFVKDADGERLDLAEGDSLEPASALKAKVEAANASKEGQDAVGHSIPPLTPASVIA
jgi:hypothetical protein